MSNCEKVIDINLPSTTPKLIIDATFEVMFDEIPVTANTIVKLRLSSDYLDNNIPTVTNATVFLTNLNNNTIINFSDTNAEGNYEPNSPFIPQYNTDYQLTVIYNNETYIGNATRIISTVINSVQQGDGTLFTGNEIELKTSFTDDGAAENFYLLNYDYKNYVVIEDRFINGSEYNFSYYIDMEKLNIPTTIPVKLSGVTKEYFTYFRILIDQSGQNAGGPFETVPSSLLGNMINITNEQNFPLGYFHIADTDKYFVDIN